MKYVAIFGIWFILILGWFIGTNEQPDHQYGADFIVGRTFMGSGLAWIITIRALRFLRPNRNW